MPNYIRVKQINQGELTGFFVDSISSESGLLLAFASGAASGVILNETVLLTGNQNISGIKTFNVAPIVSGNQLITGNLSLYATNVNLASTGSTLTSSINSLNSAFTGFTGNLDATYATDSQLNSTGSNLVDNINSLSGYVNSTNSNIVFTTGNQSISDDKTFLNNLNISGDLTLNGGLYINDIEELNLTGANIYADNLVYNTGNQNISGTKTFLNNQILSGDIRVSGTGIFNALDLNNVDNLSLSGVDITITSGVVQLTNPVSAPNLVYNTGNQTISGTKNFAVRPTVNGSGVLLSGETAGGAQTIGENIVYTTGNQTISGDKTFVNKLIAPTGFFGSNNLFSGLWVGIGAGSNNFASGDYSFIGGGQSNTASGNLASIGGGKNNCAVAEASTIGGGWNNCAEGRCSIVGGGACNYASDLASTIGGGRGNTISERYSFIGGGFFNTICVGGTSSVIGGGERNCILNADYSYIIGGRCSVVQDSHDGAAVLGDGQSRAHLSSGANTLTLDFVGGVYFGQPNIFGELKFNSSIRVDGDISISGTYNIYPQIENTKKLAIAYATAL